MSWTNSHLYLFKAGRVTWGPAYPDFGGNDLPDNKFTLGQIIEDTGKKTINYTYDFGDNWEHQHLKDWYGGTFDPNQPETDELKLEVLKLAKRWKESLKVLAKRYGINAKTVAKLKRRTSSAAHCNGINGYR